MKQSLVVRQERLLELSKIEPVVGRLRRGVVRVGQVSGRDGDGDWNCGGCEDCRRFVGGINEVFGTDIRLEVY